MLRALLEAICTVGVLFGIGFVSYWIGRVVVALWPFD